MRYEMIYKFIQPYSVNKREDAYNYIKAQLLGDFVRKTHFNFAYNIKFSILELPDIDVYETVDKHSSDDGTYYFNGIQYEFKELEEIIKERCFIMKLEADYEEKSNEN